MKPQNGSISLDASHFSYTCMDVFVSACTVCCTHVRQTNAWTSQASRLFAAVLQQILHFTERNVPSFSLVRSLSCNNRIFIFAVQNNMKTNLIHKLLQLLINQINFPKLGIYIFILSPESCCANIFVLIMLDGCYTWKCLCCLGNMRVLILYHCCLSFLALVSSSYCLFVHHTKMLIHPWQMEYTKRRHVCTCVTLMC